MTRWRALFLTLVSTVLLAGRPPDAAAPRTGDDRPTLTAAFGGLVLDTNGDGVPDLVSGRVVVPATPTVREIRVAANIAARLGLESSAMTLPLVVRDSSTAIGKMPLLLGRSNALVTRLEQQGVVDLKSLQKGQGLIAAVRAPSGEGTAIVIAGADDEGTLAAANEFASRLPRAWSVTGATLSGLEDQVTACLKENGADCRA